MKHIQERMQEGYAMDKRMAVVEPSLGKETLQKDWQQEIDCQVETND